MLRVLARKLLEASSTRLSIPGVRVESPNTNRYVLFQPILTFAFVLKQSSGALTIPIVMVEHVNYRRVSANAGLDLETKIAQVVSSISFFL